MQYQQIAKLVKPSHSYPKSTYDGRTRLAIKWYEHKENDYIAIKRYLVSRLGKWMKTWHFVGYPFPDK